MVRLYIVPKRFVVVLSAWLLALCLVSVAGAHAGVEPGEVPPASNITFTLQVPNEKDVPTTDIRLEFPPELVVSRFQPKSGWQRAVETDGAGRIVAATWTGGQIGPGEYDAFDFIARTPRAPGQLIFKAYQTYQGGEVVEWVNVGGEDRPAPIVTVAQAAAAAGVGGPSIENAGQATTTAEGSAAEDPAAQASPSGAAGSTVAAAAAGDEVATTPGSVANDAPSSGSDIPLFVALGSLVVALVALALAGIALVQRRRTA